MSLRVALTGLLMVLVVSMLPRHSLAGSGGEKATVAWMVVYASNQNDKMDARLKPLQSSLEALRFTGFEVLSDGERGMKTGETQQVSLPGGRTLEVVLIQVEPEKARLQVKMSVGDKILTQTQLVIARNGTFLFGGVKHQEGRLVIPIRVKY